jgi:hypothetical protein
VGDVKLVKPGPHKLLNTSIQIGDLNGATLDVGIALSQEQTDEDAIIAIQAKLRWDLAMFPRSVDVYKPWSITVGGAVNLAVTGTQSPTLISGVGTSRNLPSFSFHVSRDFDSVTITDLPPAVLIS